MFRRLEERAYWWLRVPPEPEPPAGAPGSLQTFRAGKNYLYLRMVLWTGTQIGAIIGLVFSLYFIQEVELQIEMERAANQREAMMGEKARNPASEAEAEAAGAVAIPEERLVEVEPGVYETAAEEAPVEVAERRVGDMPRGVVHTVFHNVFHAIAPWWLKEIPKRIPGDALMWIKLGESIGLVAFVIQFFWSLLAVRIDYAQRWYMVTDRSLRLRWGVVRIQETTMSFANLQQVSVKQGPLQRLLKLADVEVRSAGGGSSESEQGGDDSMHRSVFRAVENASEIRDLILTRLKRYRQAGLGEPDDVPAATETEASVQEGQASGDRSQALAAATALWAEARTWREALRGRD